VIRRVGGLDSGKFRDASALVAVEVDRIAREAYVKGAKQWKGRNYLDMEREVAEIHQRKPFNLLAVEINSVGAHVIEVLKVKRIPVAEVVTTKDIKDPKKRQDPRLLDKNEMVRQILHWQQENALLFPASPTPEIAELLRQLSIFSEFRTEGTGSYSYRAPGNEHDDLVMALMMALFVERHYIGTVSRTGAEVAVSKRVMENIDPSKWLGSGQTRDIMRLGTGVPKTGILKGRSSWFPS